MESAVPPRPRLRMRAHPPVDQRIDRGGRDGEDRVEREAGGEGQEHRLPRGAWWPQEVWRRRLQEPRPDDQRSSEDDERPPSLQQEQAFLVLLLGSEHRDPPKSPRAEMVRPDAGGERERGDEEPDRLGAARHARRDERGHRAGGRSDPSHLVGPRAGARAPPPRPRADGQGPKEEPRPDDHERESRRAADAGTIEEALRGHVRALPGSPMDPSSSRGRRRSTDRSPSASR